MDGGRIMSKMPCDVIRDLLPLYSDQVCSAATIEKVEEHIAECQSCQNILDKMKASLPLPMEAIEKNKAEGAELKQITIRWNRAKGIAFAKGLIIATAVCGVLLLSYMGLFHWDITKVPTNVAQISDVSQLKDGRLTFHVQITDGYELNHVKYVMDENGNFYLTPVRPLIKSSRFANIGLTNDYYTVDIEKGHISREKDVPIQAVYWGSPEDNILIWQKGTPLPAASESVEAGFITSEPAITIKE
jgi:Putative zinc-finger